MIVRYDSNNSGGYWWLTDEHWQKLEEAGWKVDWVKNRERLGGLREDGRWLGALATRASKEFESMDEAIEDWASVTGLDPNSLGCECCGRPHWFYKDWGDE